MERHHLGVTRNALRENRLVIFGLCSIGLRRHGPFISCHIFLPLCFALSGTHLGSSFNQVVLRNYNNQHEKNHLHPILKPRKGGHLGDRHHFSCSEVESIGDYHPSVIWVQNLPKKTGRNGVERTSQGQFLSKTLSIT